MRDGILAPAEGGILAPAVAAGRWQEAAAQDGNSDPPAGEQRYGQHLRTISGLRDPSAGAIAADGTVYVVESGADCVRVFTQAGEAVATIGRRGGGVGELLRPQGIALAPDGRLFVADTGNHRIAVFKADGSAEAAWGKRGRGEGEFCEPIAVAVDARHVYVADAGNARVQVLDLAGKWQGSIVPFGSEAAPGRLGGVAVDEAGNLFVSDAHSHRVLKFDSAGKQIAAWGEWGSAPGLLSSPRGLFVRGQRLFVADANNHRIEVYTLDGQRLYEWGLHVIRPHEGEGRIHYPLQAAVAPGGEFALVCEAFENRVQLFGFTQEDIATQRMLMASVGGMSTHYGPRAARSGSLLAITEPENHSVLVFNTSADTPVNITVVGEWGPRPGTFIEPADVAVDERRGALFVVDAGNRQLKQFRLSVDSGAELGFSYRISAFVKAWSFEAIERAAGVQLDWPLQVELVELGPEGLLYLLDARNARVLAVDGEMRLVRSWGGYGDAAGQMRRPTDLVVDAAGRRVLVVDADRRCVLVYDEKGELRGEIGAAQVQAGELVEPYGVAAGPEGTLFVTDRGGHALLHFGGDGSLLSRRGGAGLKAGEFFKPAAVFSDDEGQVLVIDYGNHRAQEFRPDGSLLRAFGSRWYVAPARGLPIPGERP